MELTISKKSFLKGLARAHGVADRKSSMPMLSNILLSAENSDSLLIAATDLYLGLSATVEASVKKTGSIAVSARTLFDIVRALPDGDISFHVGQNRAAEIRCGKVRYKLPGMPGDDFPPLPSPEKAEFAKLDSHLVGELVALTQYGMSSDDTRPHLAGALFEGDGKLARMVTTDGHRLCKAEAKLPDGSAMLNFSMLVPNKGIGELKKLLEDAKQGDHVEIAHAGGNAFFRREGMLLSVKLADEQFPPYAKVIPQSAERTILVPRTAFTEALKRISLVANDKSGGVRLDVQEGMLCIASENPDVGEGVEEVEIDFAGTPVVIGFNAKYVLDVLNALPSDVVALELSGELDPGVIKPTGEGIDFVGVIMPMRI